MPTALTPDEFRTLFPEFDAEQFPDARLSIRLDAANHFFASDRWGELRTYAMGLYAAHFLSIAGGTGGGAGSTTAGTGIVASKSVDGASVSYDNSTASEQGAGFWNASRYGRELYQLIRLYGAGMAFVL